MRQLFSDYSAIIKGFLILFTIINYIKISFIIVLKISSYWAFHSVSAIIKYFITILTVIEKCTLQFRKKRPVGKKTPLRGGSFYRRDVLFQNGLGGAFAVAPLVFVLPSFVIKRMLYRDKFYW